MATLITLVVATDLDGVIGRAGGLPWRLPADLRHFKELTLGKPVVMGRRTHESIGRPLPDRRNIVLSRDARFRAGGCHVARSADEALELADDAPEVMVIGGAAVYALFLPRATRIHRTVVEAHVQGDVRFPALGPEWRVVAERARAADARNEFALRFTVLERGDAGERDETRGESQERGARP